MSPIEFNQAVISGGTFTSIAAEAGKSIEKELAKLQSQVSLGAFHNSAERYDAAKCHPRTREAIIQEIIDWTNSDTVQNSFLWMYGPAGTGKSSIAQTIAEMLHKAGALAASFFFSRTAAGRSTDHSLIATIVYQLTISIPELREHIAEALKSDPLIFSRSLKAQLDGLIVQPFGKLSDAQERKHEPIDRIPKLIIIDGLDECGNGKSQHHILSALFAAVRSPFLPLCFLIASRPEHDIRNFFNQKPVDSLSRRIVLDDKYKPDEDIRTFLHSRFDGVRRDHPLGSCLPSSWPSDSDIQRLVEKASGQFIYVATVMKFVESPGHWPTDRLNVVFGLMSPGKNTPFAELDALYSHIFASADDHERVVLVFTYLLLKEPTINFQMDMIEDFLLLRRGELQIILKDLHSILYVPTANRGLDFLRIFHASIADFLLDLTRSGRFFIDVEKGHAEMARYCIKHLEDLFSTRCIPTRLPILIFTYDGLMFHLPKSSPTEDLVNDLCGFDFEAYLNKPFGQYQEILEDEFPSLEPLTQWIQTNYQNYAGVGNDLENQNLLMLKGTKAMTAVQGFVEKYHDRVHEPRIQLSNHASPVPSEIRSSSLHVPEELPSQPMSLAATAEEVPILDSRTPFPPAAPVPTIENSPEKALQNSSRQSYKHRLAKWFKKKKS